MMRSYVVEEKSYGHSWNVTPHVGPRKKGQENVLIARGGMKGVQREGTQVPACPCPSLYQDMKD
jgi:hypothetical protein